MTTSVSQDPPLGRVISSPASGRRDPVDNAPILLREREALRRLAAQLKASRARVVATADETRRRMQRDVHDGAQQRLVQTIIALKLARDRAADGQVVTADIADALYHAERANAELRDLVHGILPPALTAGGLRTGLKAMVVDLDVPVDLQIDTPRLACDLETTAYFVVAEALANVVKHARATSVRVAVTLARDTLLVEVTDDGIGGADPSRGTGLIGLWDRVAAADGTLRLSEAAGGGTTLLARLPVSGCPD